MLSIFRSEIPNKNDADPFLFAHIPKTAGTSFRKGLEQVLGEKRVFKDYSEKAIETSTIIQDLIYKKNDFYKLSQTIESHQCAALCGHFSLNKYAHYFKALNTVVFLRNPAERIISEYEHFKRQGTSTKSIEDFNQIKKKQNVQSRVLQGRPIASIGLVGITERYNESLDLFEGLYGYNIPRLKENFYQPIEYKEYSNNSFIVESIKSNNETDFQLYKSAITEFDTRINLHKKGIAYTYGHITVNSHSINGWAFRAHSIKPVTLEIYLNSKLYKKVICDQYSRFCDNLNTPRRGHISFKLNFSKLFKDSDELEIRTIDTHQSISIE